MTASTTRTTVLNAYNAHLVADLVDLEASRRRAFGLMGPEDVWVGASMKREIGAVYDQVVFTFAGHTWEVFTTARLTMSVSPEGYSSVELIPTDTLTLYRFVKDCCMTYQHPRVSRQFKADSIAGVAKAIYAELDTWMDENL